jgi:hypothetical protein
MYADAESAPGRVLIIIAALPDYDRGDALVPGCRVVTCGFVQRGCINPAAPGLWRCRMCGRSRRRREPRWCRSCTSHAAGHGDIEHIGSAYGESEAELLKAAARQRIAAGHASCTSDWTQAGRGRLAGDHRLAGGAPAGRAVPGA